MEGYQKGTALDSNSITEEDRIVFYVGIIGGYAMILLDKETEKFSPCNRKILKTALSIGPVVPGGSLLISGSVIVIVFKNKERINHLLWKKYLKIKHGI